MAPFASSAGIFSLEISKGTSGRRVSPRQSRRMTNRTCIQGRRIDRSRVRRADKPPARPHRRRWIAAGSRERKQFQYCSRRAHQRDPRLRRMRLRGANRFDDRRLLMRPYVTAVRDHRALRACVIARAETKDYGTGNHDRTACNAEEHAHAERDAVDVCGFRSWRS